MNVAGRRTLRRLLVGVPLLAMGLLMPSLARATDLLAGSQGVDTSLPATDSALTVQGRGRFASLAVTVNQTKNLANQAVSITWTGGVPTVQGPGRFGANFLQIFQCWGDDDGTVPSNPGPPPEQCEQGAIAGTPGGLPGSLYPNGLSMSRVISRTDWPNFDPKVGKPDRATNVWLPFRAVNGTIVDIQADVQFVPAQGGGNYWLNTFYNIITTNEIAGAVTGSDGKGAELFQVLTGVQSSGLGCGQQTQPQPAGTKKTPKCWIVVVPRGLPKDENAGTPVDDNAGVYTSPVSPSVWANRIAIPLEFNPVDSPCQLGADERRISGSELALPSVVSWQPALCDGGDLPPFSYLPASDSSARQQLVSNQPGSPGMVVVSQPLSATASTETNPVVYAPLSLSGLVIGFNIERNPRFDAPDDAQSLAGVRVATMNLTPRLVAKLLTQSYMQAISIGGVTPTADWVKNNPAHMALDPDFLQFNPEFAQLAIADGRTFSGLQLPAGNSDAAQQVWEWVLADPEARAWLDGTADQFGMRVNPAYATTAAANSNGIAFGDPLPSSFPKSDPTCYTAPPRGPNNSVVPPTLCSTDWMPYSRSFADTAAVTRIASDGARIVENPFALSSSDVWKRTEPQYLGRRAMLALTDSPSATRFGLQTASLSRAGDNGADRTFVAVTNDSLTKGLTSMAPRAVPAVLQPQPSAAAPGAYPLTTLTYAAIRPLALDTNARADYSAFLSYASISGQVPGLKLGQLPRGYAPLPPPLAEQTLLASIVVVALQAPPPTTTTTTTAPVTTSTAPATTAPVTTSAPATTTASTAATTPSTSASSPVTPNAAPVFVPTTPNTVRPVTTTIPTTAPLSGSLPSALPAVVDTAAPETTAMPVETAATAAVAATPAPTAPDPADQPAGSGAGVITPVVRLAKSRYAIPGLGAVALASSLFALEITKRPRRRAAAADAAGSNLIEVEP